MNPVRKVYCRIFQQCFHIAIPFLPYREPKIMRNIEDLVPLLKKKHITRVLLVTDKGIRNLGITSYLEDAFKKRKIYRYGRYILSFMIIQLPILQLIMLRKRGNYI